MSNDNKSDIQQAAENVDTAQLKSNLQQDSDSDSDSDSAESPKSLSDNEQTPFIDNESRTD